MLAALDLPTGQMFYRFRDRKRWTRWCAPEQRVPAEWIECEYTALRYFTLDGSDSRPHAAQAISISPATSAGTTNALNPNDASLSTPRSADPPA